MRAIHYYIYGIHKNLEPILTFPKGRDWLSGEWETHPNLPKGKELVTGRMDEKPILTFIRDWCRTKGRGEWVRAMRDC
ncbi:hypothetical protein ST41_00365 [Prevotella pectinovora]|nr:hypothetical protein ST41_00365 [Prevotella pectinovora]